MNDYIVLNDIWFCIHYELDFSRFLYKKKIYDGLIYFNMFNLHILCRPTRT